VRAHGAITALPSAGNSMRSTWIHLLLPTRAHNLTMHNYRAESKQASIACKYYGHMITDRAAQDANPAQDICSVCLTHGPRNRIHGCGTISVNSRQVEFINLKGTSKEKPAVCKYTGNRYYSLPHTWLAH
jgi:hypothetical protein